MYLFSRSCLFVCLLNLQGCDQIATRISAGTEDRSRNPPDSVAEDRVVTRKGPTPVPNSRSVNDAVQVHNTTEEEVIFRRSPSSKNKDVSDTLKLRAPNATLDSGLGVSLVTEGGELVPSILLQGDSGVVELKSDQ